MADIKTHLRELSVATTVGLLNMGIEFNRNELYDSQHFFEYAQRVISNDISNAKNLCILPIFSGDLKQIVDNGYNLGRKIISSTEFYLSSSDKITWLGNDTQKEDPVDIQIGAYGFSLKEESFILENMGLYRLLNCYTGSNYGHGTRHIFKDYAPIEYANWFSITWNELLKHLSSHNNEWHFVNRRNKRKQADIKLIGDNIQFNYIENGRVIATSELPISCTIENFEANTSSKTREHVFSKFINENLEHNVAYNTAKRECSVASTEALAYELNSNLNYRAGLPRFLRIHCHEYYYAKTTVSETTIYKVPSIASFGDDIIIESIKSFVPDKQANILTTIRNRKTGKSLVLRNECRFSHGQFNGTPEAKMYYEHGGSLLAIYEAI